MISTVEISSCEVCGNANLRRAINLGHHPMCDDLVPIDDDRICKEYPIEILFCENCSTALQRFQIPKRDLFPSTYHYRSRHTADVLNGMQELVVATCAAFGELKGKKVLDIGCNDGSLLSFFSERGAIPFGIEPTGAAADAAARGYTIVNDFFSERSAERFVSAYGAPDLITFTNVFAHIEDLQAVIRALKIVAHSGSAIVIENHYLGAILDKNQFDTFYHEHPRTYSLTSFIHIAKSLGMEIVCTEFPKRYGGNVRVILRGGDKTMKAESNLREIVAREATFSERIDQLSTGIEIWKANKLEQLSREVSLHGPLAAKAFPGRAAIPIKMLGLSAEQVFAAFEKPGSAKVGNYIPGTRIPIRSDDDFSTDYSGDAALINLAWHIGDEIRTYLRKRGYSGRIIDIISSDDFVKQG